MAVGEDIFCMALPAQQKPFEVMQDVDANAAIGDPVAVLGNADGVVNPIMGSITGIGPTFIEVDAPFLQDNSGGPIIHLKTGKVIGVAAYQVKNKYDMDDAPISRRRCPADRLPAGQRERLAGRDVAGIQRAGGADAGDRKTDR